MTTMKKLFSLIFALMLLFTLTAFATKMTKAKHSVAGPRYFKYKGEWLNDLRSRMGV